jgi:hypothetical protein
MMQPTDFPQANVTFGPPPDMTEGQVRPVRAHVGRVSGGSCDGAQLVVTAWFPDAADIQRMIGGGPIYLAFVGGLPPHLAATTFEEATNIS